MLSITIGKNKEYWDSKKEEFVYFEPVKVELEFSLAAISKWESKYRKPFFVPDFFKDDPQYKKTQEEIMYLLECMVTNDADPSIFYRMSDEESKIISDYISEDHTATWFEDSNSTKGASASFITSEIIYYWMVAYNIPSEFQYWNLSRLLTLIRVYKEKNQEQDSSQASQSDMLAEQRKLNAIRRKQLNSRG